MNAKTAKKLRQIAKRQAADDRREHLKKAADALAAMEADAHKRLDELVKKPPRWIPDFVWFTLARIFLNI